MGYRDWRHLMRRREIRLVNLGPVVGSEAARKRPGVIVSNDGANTTAERLGRGVITIVPVTSNIDHIYPFQTLLSAAETGLDVDSKAQAEQVRSTAIKRIGRLVGTVPIHLMDQLEDALSVHLSL
jgi:mRNA interferase MazF